MNDLRTRLHGVSRLVIRQIAAVPTMADVAGHRIPALTLLLCLLFISAAHATTLDFAGVLGNSGVAGDALVRVNTRLKTPDGQGVNSGVYLDREARVWVSGGDAINCLDFEGRLLKRSPLQPLGVRINSTAFAALDGVLYSFGHLTKANPKTRSDVALFALPLDGTGAVTVAAEFPEYPSWRCGILCPTPHAGKLLYAYPEERDGVKRIIVGVFDPRAQTRERLYDLPGQWPASLAVAADGQSVYLGGYFGKYIGANLHHPNACEIVKLTWDGKELWRRVCLDTPAEPTQFRGVLSVAGGAVWDSAWYGFLTRFDRDGKTAPGKVASWDMRIPYISQILDVRGSLGLLPPTGVAVALDPLLVTCNSPEHSYLATWDDQSGRLVLDRRYGALPEVGNVALSPEGWVNVGGLWWRFDDAANAAPRFANHTGAVSPGVWRDDWVCALTLGKRTIPTVGRPAFGRASAQPSHDMPAPFTQVMGFTVTKTSDPAKAIAYATESESNRIWRSTMEPRLWAPRKEWKALTAVGITAPGDIAALDDGTLVVVDGGSLVRLAVTGDTLTERARLTQWGAGGGETFGAKLRLAGDGMRLLVSDTDRHRVLLLDAERWQVIAQFGVTDQAGSEQQQLSAPGAVALAGARALVADVGNQRVVKLRVKGEG
jgi:hypothetical protein